MGTLYDIERVVPHRGTMRMVDRLVDWDEDSVDAEPWLHFTAAQADGDAGLTLSHVDPDADFSYDYADLDFRRTQACR